MSYNLNIGEEKKGKKLPVFAALKKLITIIGGERRNITLAFMAIFLNAGLSLTGPYLVGYTIDNHVQAKNYPGILLFAGILLVVYVAAFIVNYTQMRMMGGIGQRMLFRLRNSVFEKLQELPLDFFNQNKAGDLISRINNDAEKVNQFFSQSLMQFIGSLITMTGAGILLLVINFPLGLAALMPAILLWIFTGSISSWVRRKNEASLKSLGNLSAEVQESLANFRVVIAFNRRDYFRKHFGEVNRENYNRSVEAGIGNNLLMPVYTFGANLGQLIVLALGIWFIIKGHFTIGLLISFISYASSFYNPMRQMAALWANFQLALAAWDRISHLLSLENNLQIMENKCIAPGAGPSQVRETPGAGLSQPLQITDPPVVQFKNVSFSYPNGKEVLHQINFSLQKGKTYAFVGPTGGGKTTTASLIARLYDTTKGIILLDGRDIRTYTPCERTAKIGFILQEPVLFSGTIRENILIGNPACAGLTSDQLETALEEAKLSGLLRRFDKGLDTPVLPTGDGISLGQKQLIAFIRAILRKPGLLILDEATANIDTITEQQLEAVLKNLPETTTRVIIAHRLNTIENAGEIFFVNSGRIIRAGSFSEALDMLMHGKTES